MFRQPVCTSTQRASPEPLLVARFRCTPSAQAPGRCVELRAGSLSPRCSWRGGSSAQRHSSRAVPPAAPGPARQPPPSTTCPGPTSECSHVLVRCVCAGWGRERGSSPSSA
jgi:hypothetical protein